MRRAVASILQAFLRTDRDISLRPWGRRCLADHHLRTWCPPNKPPRVSSGLGNPGSNPGGATSKPDLTMCEVGLRGSACPCLLYYNVVCYIVAFHETGDGGGAWSLWRRRSSRSGLRGSGSKRLCGDCGWSSWGTQPRGTSTRAPADGGKFASHSAADGGASARGLDG